MSIITEGTATKQIKVSYGESIRQTKMSTSTLNDVLETIQTDKDIAEKINEVRATEDKEEKGKLKLQLPYFNLGLFDNNERKNDKFISTQFMIIDIDGLKSMELKLLKLKLLKNSYVFSYFVSPSGDGLKVILRFSETIKESKLFTENYKLYAEWFEEEFNVKADKTSDAARACFFSSDSDLFLNKNAERLEVKDFSSTPTQPTQKRKARNKKDAQVQKDSTPKSSNLLKPQSTGDRHGALTSAISRFIKLGMKKEVILDIALAMNSQNDPPKSEAVIAVMLKVNSN